MIKKALHLLINRLGKPIRDERTGKILGCGIVWRWRGQIWLIGLHRPYVRAVFLPQMNLKYARHRIGFATPEPVDYPRLLPQNETGGAAEILWATLFHQSPQECEAILNHWRGLGYAMDHILVVHGGRNADFEGLSHPHKVFVSDENLRTRRHPVEKQSYAGPLRETARWMAQRTSFKYVCLVEYDHLPAVANWGARLIRKTIDEKADVLFHHLTRVDGTNAPHYLYHLADPGFAGTWEGCSLREDRKVVLNCMATGSFWKRQAFEAVAATPESRPVYLEMYLPTQAHHLGFRVRDHGEQNEFVNFDSLSAERVHTFWRSGAWSLHPVKNLHALPPQ